MTYLTRRDFDRATHAAFMAKCAAAPADDTPRLVYADWLEEWGGRHGDMVCPACNGTMIGEPDNDMPNKFHWCIPCKASGRVPTGAAERAEFIRVQCEKERLPLDWRTLKRSQGETKESRIKRRLDLHIRERELWDAHSRDWFADRLGFGVSLGDHKGPEPSVLGIARRGFVHTVRGPLGALLGDGRTPGALAGLGAELLAVVRAEPTDRAPGDWAREDGAARFVWTVRTENQVEVEHDIPRAVFDLLTGGEKNAGNWVCGYPTEAAARAALSAAILRLARRAAGLES